MVDDNMELERDLVIEFTINVVGGWGQSEVWGKGGFLFCFWSGKALAFAELRGQLCTK